MKKLTINDLKKHIKKCDKKNVRYNWLGFTENKDLTPEVESLFTLYGRNGYKGYEWVNGNEKLRELIKSTKEAQQVENKPAPQYTFDIPAETQLALL